MARFTAVEDESVKPFQKLIFVIRDWGSPDEFNYGFEGGNEFINAFLKIRDFHTDQLKKVRQHMQNTFESIEGFLLPYPGKMVARNSSYDGRWSGIEEDFVDAMKELIPALLAPKNLVLKTVNGVTVKAFEFSVYIKQYVDLFKSESLPEAKSIYESTLDNQFQILMSKAIEIYLESIQLYQNKIRNVTEIAALHKASKAMSLKYFDEERKFGNDEETMAYRKEVEEKLEKAYDEWHPITSNFLESIKHEQEEADKQNELAAVAKKKNENEKKNFEVSNKKYQDLLKDLERARGDSNESRREAEIVRAKLAQAEKERKEALDRELKTNQHYSNMKQRADQLEQQLLIERQRQEERLQHQVQNIRKRDGFTKFFEGVVFKIGSIVQKIGVILGL